MEILRPEQYPEYEAFIQSHPQGGVTQSVLWHQVKNNWGHEVVVSRREDGGIAGGVSVLIRKFPFGTTMLYAPRGMVCDAHDIPVYCDLKSGVDHLAGMHNAHLFKMDPDVPADDRRFHAQMAAMGFRNIKGGEGFENIQARFNWRLYLNDSGEDEILAGMTQKTRYNIRVAQKHGVQIRIMSLEALPDFMRLMRVTGTRDGFATRPQSYFERLLKSLGGHARLYMAYLGDEAVSGAITTNYAGKTCYLYGASDNAHRNAMPNYLLQWEMIRWAIETNCTVYDFQGVSGNLQEGHPLYGLYRFKRGFGGQLDELAGEFDFVYMPVRAKLADKAVDLNESLRGLRRKLARS